MEALLLNPGETFTYTSGSPLTTPFGMMEGTCQMVTRAGEQFDTDGYRSAPTGRA